MKKYYILIAFLCSAGLMQGQNIPLYFHMSGHAALPKSDFKKHGYENGIGFQMLLLSGALNSEGRTNPWNRGFKLQIGIGAEFNRFGTQSFKVELSNPAGAMGIQQITNSSSAWYGLARGSYTSNNFIIPFGEILLGSRNFRTQENLSVTSMSGFDPLVTDTFKVNATTFGLGFGLAFKFSDHFFIEAKTTYFLGGNGTYLPAFKAQQPSNQVYYYPQTSNTNVLLTQVGITWRLGPMIKSCGCIMGVCGSMNSGGSYSPTNNTRTTTTSTPKKDPMQRGTSKTTTQQTPGSSTPSNSGSTPAPPKKRIEVKPDSSKPVPR